MRRPEFVLALAAALVASGGCEPDSVTAARDQLGRGPSRAVRFTIPLAGDTLTIGEFLAGDSASDADTATTAGGLQGVRFQPESITVDVGSRLEFEAVAFDPFTFSYDQMLVTQQVTTSIALPAPPGVAAMATPDTVRFDTPEGSRVTGATIAAGQIVRTVTNSTDCDASTGVTLTDAGGGAVATFGNANVPQGTTLVDSVSAGGASVNQFVRVDPTASFGACVPTTGSVGASFTFRPMTLASVTLQNVSETFSENYAALAGESRIQAVDTVLVASGSLGLTVENRLPVPLALVLTVQGIRFGAVTLQRNFNVPAAPGTGSAVSATLTVNLAGATITPGAVLATAQGTAAAANATVTPAATTDAVRVNGSADFVVAYLVGTLDPAETPELTVDVENFEQVDADAVDFGDFEDAVKGAVINDAALTFAIGNALGTPLTLDAYTVGLARLDAGGNPRRDGGGNIMYETGAGGAPLVLPIAQPGGTQVILPPGDTVSVSLTNAAALVDRLVHLVLDDTAVALIGSGQAIVGDGVTSGRIDASDVLVIDLDVLVGLDLTLPDSGVVFTVTDVVDGLDLDSADADDLVARLLEARASSDAENGIPFGVTIEIALIDGDRVGGGDASAVNVFGMPGHVALTPVTLGPAPANPATGQATGSTSDSVEAELSPADSRVLFGSRITTTVRIRVRPPAGSGGRGAVRTGDPLILNARASVAFQTGGTP